jgi:hypothetical protein
VLEVVCAVRFLSIFIVSKEGNNWKHNLFNVILYIKQVVHFMVYSNSWHMLKGVIQDDINYASFIFLIIEGTINTVACSCFAL